MLFSSRENWQAMFDHVDCRDLIYDFEGKPRSFEELLKSTPRQRAVQDQRRVAQAERHLVMTMDAMDRLQLRDCSKRSSMFWSSSATISVRFLVMSAARRSLSTFGDSIRNAPAPAEPTEISGTSRIKESAWKTNTNASIPATPALGTYIAAKTD